MRYCLLNSISFRKIAILAAFVMSFAMSSHAQTGTYNGSQSVMVGQTILYSCTSTVDFLNPVWQSVRGSVVSSWKSSDGFTAYANIRWDLAGGGRVKVVDGAIDYGFYAVTVTTGPACPTIGAPAVNPTSVTICSGSSATFTGTPGTNGTKVKWYDGTGTYLSEGTSFTTPILTNSKSYPLAKSFYAQTYDNNGCNSTVITSVTVTVNPPVQQPLVGYSTTTFGHGSVTLWSMVPDEQFTTTNVRWFNVATGGTALDSGFSFTTPHLYAPQSYYAEAYNFVTGCISAIRREVIADIRPVIAAAKVTTDIVRAPGIKNDTQVDALTEAQRTTQVTHIDGLQRVAQKIVKKGSPLGMDMVQPVEYDSNGRSTKNYLPYVASTTDGSFHSDYKSKQHAFYNNNTSNNADKIANDTAFVKLKYEKSPLGRVLEKTNLGAEWQAAARHARVSYSYNTGSTASEAEEVRKFNSDGTSTGFFAANKLSRTETIDENGNKVITFTDGSGKTIAVKKQLDEVIDGVTVAYLQTYYIYDDFDHVKFIITPKGLVALKAASWVLSTPTKDNYCHQFVYDYRGRLIEKKVPGQAWMYYVYDKMDRLVLTQDGILRSLNKWVFIKYDQKRRAIMQGLYLNTTQTTRATIQTLVDGLYTAANVDYPVIAWFESRGTALQGYNNVSFPKINANSTPLEVLTVNYYESHDFDYNGARDYKYDSLSFSGSGQEGTSNWRAKGLATGSKRLIIGTTNWLSTYVFYDMYGRPIQVRSNSHLNAAVDNLATTVYDYEGKVLLTKNYHNAGSGRITTVLNRLTYDDKGRLLLTEQSNDGAAYQRIAKYEFNELGQVVDKKLHNTTASEYLQSVDYRYSIQGWLKSINNSAVTNDAGLSNDETTDYFGMELLYQNTDAGLANTSSYNGSVTAVKWKGPGMTPGVSMTPDQRAYKYTYDKANQLKTATSLGYTGTTWNKENGVHNESMTYDHNGNIKSLQRVQRKHQLVGISASYTTETIDSLTYSYNSAIGDQLLKVEDASASTQGFANGANIATEYTYDTNGNITADKNKGIDSVHYNFLGKVRRIKFTDGRIITYTYDAAGSKLKMKNFVSGAWQTTDYVQQFVYQNDTLRFFGSPEGRVVKNASGFEYQYAIADHQGNTRIVFTSAIPTPDEQKATFEGDTNDDAGQFKNVNNVVSFGSAAASGTKVVRLDKNSKIGPAKSFRVYPGDKIDIEVTSYHEGADGFGTSSTPLNTLITSVAGAFSSGMPSGESTLMSAGVSNALTLFGRGSNQGDERPAAYLNYILFDKNYNVLNAGWRLVHEETFTKDTISFPTRNITEEGYLYAYLSYDNDSEVPVYFDDFKVTHTKTNIVQYNEYYPFGLQASTSWTRENSTNNHLYNQGSELDANSGWYETFFRGYDASLGRFMQVDPLAHEFSDLTPYQYAGNNPSLFNDPNGDKIAGGNMFSRMYEGFHAWQGGHSAEGFDNWMNSTGFMGVGGTGGAGAGKGYYNGPAHMDETIYVDQATMDDIINALAQQVNIADLYDKVLVRFIKSGAYYQLAGNGLFYLPYTDIVVDPWSLAGATQNVASGQDLEETCPECINPSTLNHNLLWLSYPGGDNPLTFSGKYSYSHVPKRFSEYPAIGHDRRYDNLGTAGISGLFGDTRAIGADWKFVGEELEIAASPFINPVDRIQAGILGIGLGALALPKTILHLSSRFGFGETMMRYNVSNVGVTNAPSIHKH